MNPVGRLLGENIEIKRPFISPKAIFNLVKELFLRFLGERSSPFERALGLSLGVLVAFIPVIGFQSFILIGLALLVPRANRVALLLGFEAIKLIPFPIYLWIEWKAGSIFVHSPSIGSISHLSEIPRFLPSLMVGGIVIGLVVGLFAFLGGYFVIKKAA